MHLGKIAAPAWPGRELLESKVAGSRRRQRWAGQVEEAGGCPEGLGSQDPTEFGPRDTEAAARSTAPASLKVTGVMYPDVHVGDPS